MGLRGRPYPLLRGVTWLHTLPTFAAIPVELVSRTHSEKVSRLAEVFVAMLAMVPAYVGTTPYRQLSFAFTTFVVLRVTFWIRRLLVEVVGESKVRPRTPGACLLHLME